MGPTTKRLRDENEELRQRLDEAEATLRALSSGEVDAVVVAERERVLTLELPDMPYRLAVEQLPHPAVTLSQNGNIIYGNRRFADLLGVPAEALPGKPLESFVTTASRAAFQKLMNEGCEQAASADITLQPNLGMAIPAHLGASPMREGALGSCVVIADLTSQRHYEELRRTQEALRTSERQLREADRRKDEFVATLAHELRNPLLPMRNAIDFLRAKGSLQPELEWARGVLERQVNLMARLLDDLLDVSRIAYQALELRPERVSLAGVIEAAVETTRPLIDAGRHELVVRLPNEPVYLRADPVRLAQVFGNLLSNAAKYTEPGGRITVTVEKTQSRVAVSVSDTGIGIEPEMLPRIFEIFTQAKQAKGRAQGGLGIGLSLVKGLVELHGGTVAATSAGAGQGSEFIVRLPV